MLETVHSSKHTEATPSWLCFQSFWLPLIIVSLPVRRTALESSQLNWEGSFPFWQWYAHVTVRSCWAIDHWKLFAGGDLFICNVLCYDHHTTWTQRHVIQENWCLLIVAAKIKWPQTSCSAFFPFNSAQSELCYEHVNQGNPSNVEWELFFVLALIITNTNNSFFCDHYGLLVWLLFWKN